MVTIFWAVVNFHFPLTSSDRVSSVAKASILQGSQRSMHKPTLQSKWPFGPTVSTTTRSVTSTSSGNNLSDNIGKSSFSYLKRSYKTTSCFSVVKTPSRIASRNKVEPDISSLSSLMSATKLSSSISPASSISDWSSSKSSLTTCMAKCVCNSSRSSNDSGSSRKVLLNTDIDQGTHPQTPLSDSSLLERQQAWHSGIISQKERTSPGEKYSCLLFRIFISPWIVSLSFSLIKKHGSDNFLTYASNEYVVSISLIVLHIGASFKFQNAFGIIVLQCNIIVHMWCVYDFLFVSFQLYISGYPNQHVWVYAFGIIWIHFNMFSYCTLQLQKKQKKTSYSKKKKKNTSYAGYDVTNVECKKKINILCRFCRDRCRMQRILRWSLSRDRRRMCCILHRSCVKDRHRMKTYLRRLSRHWRWILRLLRWSLRSS